MLPSVSTKTETSKVESTEKEPALGAMDTFEVWANPKSEMPPAIPSRTIAKINVIPLLLVMYLKYIRIKTASYSLAIFYSMF